MIDRHKAYRAGRWAESIAANVLRLKGYRVLARRVRTPVGEIDLVVRRGAILAFVEVKQRADLTAALEAVRPQQAQRIVRAAQAFVAMRPELADLQMRFDVFAVLSRRWPCHIIDAWRP